ncbi:hypothetical protein ACIA8O_07905 [Kitasatospora sp. NPDC051853]|uniref:hypothetical protein n=1 Tax=Kitasatospora sp. NPDC051853 TaxID=3364058 RepID=UPI00379895C8
MTGPIMLHENELPAPWRFRLGVLMTVAGVASGAVWGAVLEFLVYGPTYPILGALAGTVFLLPVFLLTLGVLCALPRRIALDGRIGPALAFLATVLGEYLVLGQLLRDAGAFEHPLVAATALSAAGAAAVGALIAVHTTRRTLKAAPGQP